VIYCRNECEQHRVDNFVPKWMGLVLVATLQLAAQGTDPSPADAAEARVVRELLASNDSASKAWGAELAARYQRPEAIPDLLNLLNWTDDRVQEHAIDALIRLRAKVSSETLRQIARGPGPAIVLAVFNHNVAFLQELLTGPLTDSEWVAANEGILGPNTPRTYVVDLLKSWTVHVAVRVADRGSSPVVEDGQGGGVCGDSFSQKQTGFPPRAAYRIQLNADPGDQVLVARPHPVYYRRGPTGSGCDAIIDRDAYRSDFLRFVMNAPPGQITLKARVEHNIAWTDAGDYARQLQQVRGEIDTGFKQIVERLSPRYDISNDVGLNANIDWHVIDLRSNPQPPLTTDEPPSR
jgi:hypothetical protein